MTQLSLEEPYENVIQTHIVGPVDHLLRASLSTQVNSISLGQAKVPVGSLTGLKGLGKEIWAGRDAQRYVDGLRNEWDK